MPFAQVLIISQAFKQGNLLGFGQNASEIIPYFHKYRVAIWLGISITGEDKLRSQFTHNYCD